MVVFRKWKRRGRQTCWRGGAGRGGGAGWGGGGGGGEGEGGWQKRGGGGGGLKDKKRTLRERKDPSTRETLKKARKVTKQGRKKRAALTLHWKGKRVGHRLQWGRGRRDRYGDQRGGGGASLAVKRWREVSQEGSAEKKGRAR